jgi:secondary thiamine-phosphate synthase enzyme
MLRKVSIQTARQGLHEITDEIASAIQDAAVQEGLCTIFVQHTSASLIIQENADPSAKRDLEAWLNRLVVENDPLFTHNDEGPDDMPSHIKAALTATSIGIPISGGRLALGRWQGIYLWEHRHASGSHPRTRAVVVHVSE